jgi:hypothetical protein
LIPLGLIAGRGRLPFELARGARRGGQRIAAVGLEGFAEPGLGEAVDDFASLPLGQLTRHFAFLRRRGVKQGAGGKVPKRVLYAGRAGCADAPGHGAARVVRPQAPILLEFAGPSGGFELLAQSSSRQASRRGEARSALSSPGSSRTSPSAGRSRRPRRSTSGRPVQSRAVLALGVGAPTRRSHAGCRSRSADGPLAS